MGNASDWNILYMYIYILVQNKISLLCPVLPYIYIHKSNVFVRNIRKSLVMCLKLWCTRFSWSSHEVFFGWVPILSSPNYGMHNGLVMGIYIYPIYLNQSILSSYYQWLVLFLFTQWLSELTMNWVSYDNMLQLLVPIWHNQVNWRLNILQAVGDSKDKSKTRCQAFNNAHSLR